MKKNQSSVSEEFSYEELQEKCSIPAFMLFICIEKVLNTFSHLFKNEKQFFHFQALILGFMLATDKVGVISSAMRGLKFLSQAFYHRLDRFIHSNKNSLSKLREHWLKIALDHFQPMITEDGSIVFLADHSNVPKDGIRIPGIMKIVSSSVSAAKKEITDCLVLGCICLLTVDFKAVPLLFRRHGGLDDILPLLLEKDEELFKKILGEWPDESNLSLVEKIAMDVQMVAEIMGITKVIVVLDRLFASEKLFNSIAKWNLKDAVRKLFALVRFRTTTVAWTKKPEKPEASLEGSEPGKRLAIYERCWLIKRLMERKGRGRPRTKGVKIKLDELFTLESHFKPARVRIYGEMKSIKYFSSILLWGKYMIPIRFTLVIVLDEKDEAKRRMILGTNKLEMNPLEMISLYSYRFRIEQFFRDAKQETAAAKGRFFSFSAPRYSRFKDLMLERYQKISDAKSLKGILKAIKAMEMFIFMSSVSLALIYYLCDQFKDRIEDLTPEFSRKKKDQRKVTVTVIQQTLRAAYSEFLRLGPKNSLMRKNLFEEYKRGLKKASRKVKPPEKEVTYTQETLF